MASPVRTGKQSIDLAAPRASRIRRDPPPVAKKTLIPDRGEVDRRAVAIGIVTFALAIVVIVIGFGHWAGWSPSQYSIHIRDGD